MNLWIAIQKSLKSQFVMPARVWVQNNRLIKIFQGAELRIKKIQTRWKGKNTDVRNLNPNGQRIEHMKSLITSVVRHCCGMTSYFFICQCGCVGQLGPTNVQWSCGQDFRETIPHNSLAISRNNQLTNLSSSQKILWLICIVAVLSDFWRKYFLFPTIDLILNLCRCFGSWTSSGGAWGSFLATFVSVMAVFSVH